MWWANEQLKPVPSGSMFNALITPSSTSIEYLIDLVPPKAGISVDSSIALVKAAHGSDSRRTCVLNTNKIVNSTTRVYENSEVSLFLRLLVLEPRRSTQTDRYKLCKLSRLCRVLSNYQPLSRNRVSVSGCNKWVFITWKEKLNTDCAVGNNFSLLNSPE